MWSEVKTSVQRSVAISLGKPKDDSEPQDSDDNKYSHKGYRTTIRILISRSKGFALILFVVTFTWVYRHYKAVAVANDRAKRYAMANK